MAAKSILPKTDRETFQILIQCMLLLLTPSSKLFTVPHPRRSSLSNFSLQL